MRLRTALDPTINFAPRERVSLVGEALLISLAHRLPYRLRYRVYIDFAAEHMRDGDVVPDVRMLEILERAHR
jgi:hypothetical protein